MKKIFTITVYAFLLSITIFSLSAQDTLYIPSVEGGEAFGILNQYIDGDTTATGERMNLNRVYKLGKGEIYYLSGAIYADYPLNIVGEKGDDTTKPPVITSGVAENGQVVGADFFVCSNDILMKDFYIMGTPPTNLGQINRVYFLQGDGANIVFDGVTFEWGQWLCIGVFAENTSVDIQNCYFKNCENTSDVWNGRAIDFRDNPVEKLVFLNNTLFNVNSFMVRGEANIIKDGVIEHNTIVNSIKWPIQWRYQTNARVANNLFYNSHSFGETEADKENQDSDGLDFGIINLEVMPPDVLNEQGISEAERILELTNNLWFYSQPVLDYWTEYGLEGTYMNSRTEGFFSNSTDYPSITETSTFNEDPLFVNLGDSEASMVTFMGKKRNNQGSAPWGFDADNNRHSIVWPMVEDLAYTNPTIMTAGDDGFPIGDINWFPERKEEWDIMVGTSDINYDPSITDVKNYPNPFHTTTIIEFELLKPSVVSLQVYDLNGQLVHSQQEKKSNLGSNTLTVEASELGGQEGMYLYKITSDKFIAVGKLHYTKK